MSFVAYTYKGGKKLSGVHDTRQAAADELFGKYPKLASVETATAIVTSGQPTAGGNIQSVKNPAVKGGSRFI